MSACWWYFSYVSHANRITGTAHLAAWMSRWWLIETSNYCSKQELYTVCKGWMTREENHAARKEQDTYDMLNYTRTLTYRQPRPNTRVEIVIVEYVSQAFITGREYPIISHGRQGHKDYAVAEWVCECVCVCVCVFWLIHLSWPNVSLQI